VFPSRPSGCFLTALDEHCRAISLHPLRRSPRPERKLTNDDLSKLVDTNDEWIKTRSGISERRIAGPDENPSDMGAKAAAHAMQNAGSIPRTSTY